jgi:hypothetical protein
MMCSRGAVDGAAEQQTWPGAVFFCRPAIAGVHLHVGEHIVDAAAAAEHPFVAEVQHNIIQL